MTSLSGSEGVLGDAISPSIGWAQFEFLLTLLTTASVVVSVAELSVRTWYVWAVLARAGRSGHSAPLVRTLIENAGASGWKTTGGGGLTEYQGGFLVLLDVLYHVGCEPWCSRVLRRAPVDTIFLLETTCTGMIYRPALTCVGLQTLHKHPMRTTLGYRKGYISYSLIGTRDLRLLFHTAFHTPFRHDPIPSRCL